MEENVSTLSFYNYMALGTMGIYIFITMMLHEFNALTISLMAFSAIVYIGSYQFMLYMAQPAFSETEQFMNPGVDLNMEGGLAEHIKDLIIFTSGVQILSLISNYFWFLWLLVPLRGTTVLWNQIMAPWVYAQEDQQSEMNEKKLRKLERKIAKRYQ
ncbi:hypothetical protein ALC62_15888 [Cyphomyrmex costatus]|uniref:Transmembrane protein 208 n=2 Tax=Cyphomyrmex costatus TaxID=456900 RepID=A0A195BYX9_9HYME|nr:hypothetical protein ALC62_15888 [Cyphomyrmex costatus]